MAPSFLGLIEERRILRKICLNFLCAALLAAASLAQQTGAVRQISVSGNVHVSEQAILAAMRTKVGQPLDQTLLDADRQALLDMGFFEAVDITASAAQPDGWLVQVVAKEFPAIKEIRVSGNTVFKTPVILAAISFKPGDVFNLRTADVCRKNIEALYVKAGYFATVSDFGLMSDSPGTLNVTILEARVNQVKVTGNVNTKERVMRHLIKTRPGDVYSQDKWSADLKRIYESGWFAVPKDREEPDNGDYSKVDLTAEVKEQRTGQLGVGVQVDPSASFAGFLQLKETNFEGTGQTVGASLTQAINGGGPSAELDYDNPFINDHNTTLNVEVYSRLIYRFTNTAFGGSETPTNDTSYNERHTGSTVGIVQPFSDTTSGSVNARYEGIKTGGISEAQQAGQTGFIQQDGTVGSMSFGYTINRRDVDTDPSRGSWWNITLEPGTADITQVGGYAAESDLLGRHYFENTSTEFRAYASPGQKPRKKNLDDPRRVFAFRLRYGFINGTVPYFEQYFAGGADTIRGYADDRFWGKQMLLSTLEYRHPVQKSVSLIGFVDYGDTWGGFPTINTFTQSANFVGYVGYGAGVAVQVPYVGRIRLDLGIDNHGRSRAHFLIGPSF
jgi:outer membrane protein insertion porin family